MNNETETHVPNAAAPITASIVPAIQAETAATLPLLESDAEAAATKRAQELAAWLELARINPEEAWKILPAGVQFGGQDKGILLAENSLTPAQENQPHCITDHTRTFANDAEYQAFVDEKRAWAKAHYPAGVEIVPVVTADGIKTVATIGLTADQANAINGAIRERRALENQAALVQENTIIDPKTLQAKTEAIAAEMTILPKGAKVEAQDVTHEVISSTPHSPEMQDALRKAMDSSAGKGDALTMTVVYRNPNMPRTSLGKTA